MIHALPVPIPPDLRKKIDAFIAEKEFEGKTVVVPRGVSGMDVQREASTAYWRRGMNGQPKALREKLSKQRGGYRRLVDQGLTGREIAKIIGVKLPAVYQAVRRMGLKLRRSRI